MIDWKEGTIFWTGVALAIPTNGLSLAAIGKSLASFGLIAWDGPGPFWYYD